MNKQPPAQAFTAPYTSKVFEGTAKFQPIPTFTFSPSTFAKIAASGKLGDLGAGASATARFLPEIVLRPNDAGGLNVSVTPKMRLELDAFLKAGISNIAGTGLGITGGVGVSKWLTFNAPQFSANLNPDLSFTASANFNPTLTTTQRFTGNVGAGGNVSVPPFGAGAGVNQAVTHQTQQEFKLGGPGVELFFMVPTGEAKVTPNFDNTVSISNSYSFLPRSSLNFNGNAGPFNFNAGAGVLPGVTVKYKVTLSTDFAKETPPKTEVSVSPGVRLDANFTVDASLLPKEWPFQVDVSVGAQPYVSASTEASLTY
ncbi:hypothetical protein TU79_04010 [Pseudomonas trivialis]|uniref:Uncharacterized protein n=1 Tax=Pseudomonas trivialis TaxID=200450 RepID=A0A0R2ZNR0_9PSED|nr:hypothetical protein TU79_04010 [Pseudomonas trivialis]